MIRRAERCAITFLAVALARNDAASEQLGLKIGLQCYAFRTSFGASPSHEFHGPALLL